MQCTDFQLKGNADWNVLRHNVPLDNSNEFTTSSCRFVHIPSCNVQLTAYACGFQMLYGRPPKKLRPINPIRTKDAENTLVAYVQEQHQREARREAAQATRRAEDLAEAQYGAGRVDFRSVPDAARSLLSFQDQSAQSDGGVPSILVPLVKAPGGGWTPRAAGEAD